MQTVRGENERDPLLQMVKGYNEDIVDQVERDEDLLYLKHATQNHENGSDISEDDEQKDSTNQLNDDLGGSLLNIDNFNENLIEKSFVENVEANRNDECLQIRSKTEFHCKLCDITLSNKALFNKHLELHVSVVDGKTTCDICSKILSASAKVHRHIAVHLQKRLHVCSICGKEFLFASYLKEHSRMHEAERSIENMVECPTCDKKFRTPSSLRKHKRSHASEKLYVCNVCGKSFSCASVLKEHQRCHSTERPYVCETCGRQFKHDSNLQKHVRLAHTDRLYAQECGNDCYGYDMDVNQESSKHFECLMCSKRFLHSFALSLHLRVHTNERPYRCELCGKQFKQTSHLNKHKRLHNGLRPFACKTCGKKKTFSLKSNLKDHEKIHSDDRPFDCDLCNKRFITRSAQRTHVLSHQSKKDETEPFHESLTVSNLCKECGKEFADARLLKKHSVVHTGERPFPCKICGKTFKFRSNLASHRTIHSPKLKASCQICGKAFLHASSVQKHMEMHQTDGLVAILDDASSFDGHEEVIVNVDHFVYD